MTVSLEPFDRFWCFNFWVKALDVYFHCGLSAGPLDPYNRRSTAAAGSYGQHCHPCLGLAGVIIILWVVSMLTLQVHSAIMSHTRGQGFSGFPAQDMWRQTCLEFWPVFLYNWKCLSVDVPPASPQCTVLLQKRPFVIMDSDAQISCPYIKCLTVSWKQTGSSHSIMDMQTHRQMGSLKKKQLFCW